MKRRIEHDVLGTNPRPSVNKINSKRKGNRNEVALAHWLTQWVGVPFARTPASGGHHLKNRGASYVCGDVICADEAFDFPFLIETKHYKRFALSRDLRSNSALVKIYLEQAVADAELAGKKPLAFLRHNGMLKLTWYIVLNINLLVNLECELKKIIIAQSKKNPEIVVIHSDTLKSIGYESFIKQKNSTVN